ncbi:hypothetical protein CROQUDRAFT_708066 [Cronartium quercuum f. sp. fusiforme G11]|uniref:Reverse transcriptase domain-containing protein n=1 Tax=Cronartium quercuum f. sp. fusiforme G11 TaxID=708437 RepID=A0A9P6NJP1_9BASI|nr:hypothetical protein CROQUDRAFT_708066 [Cronartium quercuum f. sp. fusiforme G11]
MEKAEQAELLFMGTTITHTPVDLTDSIPKDQQHISQSIPHILHEEFEDVVKSLPKGKAKGPDGILNELIQLAFQHILVLTWRLTFWAETNQVIAEGHMGRHCQRSTDDALFILVSWIQHQWSRKQIVLGLFLDVKLAYPSVHRERLNRVLIQKNFQEYLHALAYDFLINRLTRL